MIENNAKQISILVERYEFFGFCGCRSWCDVIIALYKGRQLVLVTEREDNPGTRIKNVTAGIAVQICSQYGIRLSTVIWIERNGTRDYVGNNAPGSYEIVFFEISDSGHQTPKIILRRPMTLAEWRTLQVACGDNAN